MTLGLIVPLITASAFLLSALLLVCGRRTAPRPSRRVTLYSSLLGVSLCLASLEILLFQPSVSVWHATTSVLLCSLIFRVRGQMALLLGGTSDE
jgi:low temperature requirement protein LtrA